MHTLEPLADRLAFVRPPFDLENVAASADAFRADLLVLDYIQRIPPPGQHADKRASVNATMDYLRQFADAGVAVLVVAAVGRTKDTKGRTSYSGDGLNLARFRESSELEFGADDAFILVPRKTARIWHRDGSFAPEGTAHGTERPGAWSSTAGHSASSKPERKGKPAPGQAAIALLPLGTGHRRR